MIVAIPPAPEVGLHLHPEVIAVTTVLLVGYFYALRRWGPLFHPRPDDPPASPKQKALFVAGVVTYFVAVGWPLHDIADYYLYSGHMVQHVLLGYLAPPLLLLGTPEWLGRLVLGRGAVGRAYRRLTRPVLAGILVNVAIAFIHWPVVVEWMVLNEPFHVATHLLLFGTALLAWSVLWSPLPEVRGQLGDPGKMLFVFAMTLLPTIPASFLTFGETPLYPVYAETPNLYGLSPRDDMQLAGLIMKSGVGLVLWIVIAVMFFRWARREGALSPGGRPPAGGVDASAPSVPGPAASDDGGDRGHHRPPRRPDPGARP